MWRQQAQLPKRIALLAVLGLAALSCTKSKAGDGVPDAALGEASVVDSARPPPDRGHPDTGVLVPFLPPALQSVRAPAYPLVTHDPYFSVWAFSDTPSADWPRHWTGRVHALASMLRVDGEAHRLIGMGPDEAYACAPVSTHITPTRTVYTFKVAGVEARLIFLSPLLAQDLELVGRPASYITWQVRSTDGKPHKVEVYFDNSGELVVNDAGQQVVWSRPTVEGASVLSMGSQDQPVLAKAGDNLRIDWGYIYQAVPNGSGVRQVVASDVTARGGFASSGNLPSSDDTRMPRAANDAWPVLATTIALGSVGTEWVERFLVLAYDDIYSIEYMTERLRPYWRRNGAEAADLIKLAISDYTRLQRASAAFDVAFVADLERLGGTPLQRLGSLSYRQAIAAHKLVAGADGTPLFFSKENFSNGCIATVDVTYPSAPLFLLLNPTLLKGMTTPMLDYANSGRWKFDFAPHDLGTYPKANGQVYGGGETSTRDQMPIEESGNMLLLVAGICAAEGKTDYATQYWPLLEKWAGYLKDQGYDPANQLCTDDFAGHLAHNANLSVKAILALGAYAQLCEKTGRSEDATAYRAVAEDFASQWLEHAADGNHYRLTFDRAGTWSQKYNMVWDRLLGLKLFPAEVATKELAYYLSKQNRFGVPLDSRATYTKLDWLVWSATLTGVREDLDSLLAPVTVFLDESPSRVPLTDWFETTDGSQKAFQARSVVGGVYLPLLFDKPTWQKWLAQRK